MSTGSKKIGRLRTTNVISDVKNLQGQASKQFHRSRKHQANRVIKLTGGELAVALFTVTMAETSSKVTAMLRQRYLSLLVEVREVHVKKNPISSGEITEV